ncbi:shikimate dehydrogenase [Aeromicrobium panaciterrae]|uniref:shikimate dehydrogenase n=1 Tax=Aeromicrobium panaciterrae TaxID=363861 RepID=UPI0031DE2DED
MQCAVIGSPIAHSLSPAMHRAAYADLGLDWTYDAVLVEEAELQEFLGSLGDDVRGLSVTAPLKRRLAELVELESGPPLGVANTVVFDDGVPTTYNTDVPGAVNALTERGITRVRTVRILGGGATAASIAYALSTMGAADVELVVRDRDRAREAVGVARSAGLETSVRLLDEPLLDRVDLLVSTVPADVVNGQVHELVEASRAVFDVVYNPWPSHLVEVAGELPCATGLDLLAHQAALQVGLMTGSPVSPQLLRDAALAELGSR